MHFCRFNVLKFPIDSSTEIRLNLLFWTIKLEGIFENFRREKTFLTKQESFQYFT